MVNHSSTSIDCLIIGHNDVNFGNYIRSVRDMGPKSGAFRDLSLNFVWQDGKPRHLAHIFNDYCIAGPMADSVPPLDYFDTFSATIAYLVTYLDRRGFTYDYIHSFQDEKESLLEKLKQENILTIAITTTYYVSVNPILEIVQFIRQYNRSAKIIVGGPFIATQTRVFDEPSISEYLFTSTIGADFYVISSQGEGALVEIIKALKNHTSLDQVNNIYYKTSGGCRATQMVRENNILSENMVDWRLFKNQNIEYANVRTSISCPFACAFCGFPEHAGKYQTANVEAIEREFNLLREIETLKGIKIIDDTFNVPVNRFKEILRMMIKNKYPFKWIGNFRCQFADRETVELMKGSGCELVFLGIESGSNQILKNMNKAATVEKYVDGISLLKEYEIITFGSFIVGFPGETEKTVDETRHFLETSGIDFFRTGLWYGERITPIFQKRDEFKIEGENFEWRHATMDSKRASELIEEIFLTINIPTWLPLYNFDIDSLWHLIHRGFSLDQVRRLISEFNCAVKEKFIISPDAQLSGPTLARIKSSCAVFEKIEEDLEIEEDLDVDFDLS